MKPQAKLLLFLAGVLLFLEAALCLAWSLFSGLGGVPFLLAALSLCFLALAVVLLLLHRSVLSPLAGRVRDQDEELSRVNAALSRETAQTRADLEERKEREAYYRSLLVSMPDLIAVLDRNRTILDLNRSSFGPETDPFGQLGKTCHELFHASKTPCGPEAGCRLDAVFATGTPESFRHEHVSPGGGKVWVDVLLSPLKNPDGNVLHVIAAMRDVTREVELKGQVARASRMEAVATLAGGIAHEFNNILMTIMMNIEYATAKSRDNPKVRESLDMSLKACHRARDLVDQVLTFSRKTDQEMEVLSVTPVVKECLKMLRATLPTSVTLHEEMAAGADRVMGSPAQIRELVVNLCTNAAQALEEKGGAIRVSLSDEHSPSAGQGEDEAVLRLVVADDGPGMEPGVLDRIFEPFFTTKGPGRGTGMGLSVVHGVVEALGGTIRVLSRHGEGTRFDVLLPMVRSPRAREPVAGLPEGGATGTILVVDDEPWLVETLKRALCDYGCEVKGRTRADEALAVFRENPWAFDLVIADQVMPESSGLALAREMAGLRPDLPVVLCTGFSQEIPAEELARSGVRRVIRKPVVTAELLETVTGLLKPVERG